jgi:hypothetical protein
LLFEIITLNSVVNSVFLQRLLYCAFVEEQRVCDSVLYEMTNPVTLDWCPWKKETGVTYNRRCTFEAIP